MSAHQNSRTRREWSSRRAAIAWFISAAALIASGATLTFATVGEADYLMRVQLPTPREVAGSDDVVVGRVRPDRAFTPGLALWCVMDQLRKGAALNAVQIAERLVRS